MPVQTAIQVRRGTASSWTSTNPTLAAGEIGFETDTGKFKIGTGSTAWASLAYAAIDAGLLAAKGDLVTATANDTPTVITVGNNGDTLVADSSTSTGLRWQGNQAAGRNIVINGGMDIWQRSTSSTTMGAYATADRWYQGVWSGTGTWARESTVVPATSQYSAKFTASATAQPYFIQAIESANAIGLAGQTVTLSAQLATSSSANMDMILGYSTSVDNSVTGSYTDATLVSASYTVSTTGTLARRSVTYTIPSTAKTLRIIIQTSSTIANGAIAYIGQVQLELGSVATPFTRAGGTLAGELAACQRYYVKFGDTNQNYGVMSWGQAYSTTHVMSFVPLPVTMRIKPQSITFSNLRVNRWTSYISVSTMVIENNYTTPQLLALDATVTGAAVDIPWTLGQDNNSGGKLEVSAEL